jgi:hypothetical protein
VLHYLGPALSVAPPTASTRAKVPHRRLGGRRTREAAADHLGDGADGHTLAGDPVQHRSCQRGFQCQAEYRLTSTDEIFGESSQDTCEGFPSLVERAHLRVPRASDVAADGQLLDRGELVGG